MDVAEPVHDNTARDTGTSQAEGRLKVGIRTTLSNRRKKKIRAKRKFPHGNPDEHDYR